MNSPGNFEKWHETFPALEGIPFCRHAFINRVPGLDVNVGREEALKRLETPHNRIRQALGFVPPVTAEQVHGNRIAVVNETTAGPVAGVDGLVTARQDVCLGIYVADCCAVYLVDLRNRCIGLVHSGKKGTELGIVPAAIEIMRTSFGTKPGDLMVQLSPCIRPPFYEIDFAAGIAAQCREAGVGSFHDCVACTAADLSRYYSYRIEQGKTGRMLALFCLNDVIMPG
jgi:copper oxidase (laccase) domain-containing protein